MRFTSAISSALAMSGLSLAAPTTSTTNAPQTSSNQKSNGNYLATLYILWGEFGLGANDPTEYNAYGVLSQCYNLPAPAKLTADFDDETGSVKTAQGTSCWVYEGQNCLGPYTAVSGAGDEVYEGTSKSFICVPTPANGSK